ncbi:hypothetical protein F946_01976 [Acinetobacter johnsonii ANC 3681]|uniref:Uncharacterized protein n=1 Tax=Acinetobacter johnsonii ANC 3681 TaxID=1217662 RepID=N9BH25_ACIJO|nr:hypothetical protein [Acinetobacter johnsonii]ENV72501.1 hypothetical protein F946_01976 [Acinetobacter johnsonii ANC 3681]
MSRTALTTQDHIYSIEYFAMNNPAFESSHYDVIQLLEQKKLGELSDKEKQLIRKTYLYTKKRKTYDNKLHFISKKDPNSITKIERDILDYSYFGEDVPPVLEHYFLAEKMLDNYMSKLPDDLKIKIHQNILDTDDALEKKQNIKKRNKDNHQKFFIGGTLLSLLKSNNIDDDQLEILFKIMKLYLMQDYFNKEIFSDKEINEFNISEGGREFNNKKNSIFLNLNNPFKIYDE